MQGMADVSSPAAMLSGSIHRCYLQVQRDMDAVAVEWAARSASVDGYREVGPGAPFGP